MVLKMVNAINLETIKKIKQNTSMQVELGGGIRNIETVALYLDEVGIDRVILRNCCN